MTRPVPLMRENPNVSPNRDPGPQPGDLYRVVIIDNDYNTYQEVIDICMQALGTDIEHAYKIALAVDHNGEADVVRAPRDEAERVAEVIRSIGIEVRVLPADENT